ncbi:hypothetical protein BABINDRAFT_159634 [Babjeviella inositovora NRRL Y-12698]|uniref:Uncharacterized protein n=1 Tax=Babjeviella inositovora NRRL Y-12698 TaxID=984486 RepID=A0A1E3R065_9ASCO|nr:uncharacterized protein BABINDRAFT_159634 [Babjeviella inositovora NRRL Y-12698]ODQ83194.1 hypothetical protein BABINDRAFT_159634 [Babjeviella inositovora NRRL Y-12698]
MSKRSSDSPPSKKYKRHAHTPSGSGAVQSPFALVTTDTWLGCGRCAQLFGLTPLAITSFEAVLTHDPANMEGLTGLAAALRAHDIDLNQTLGTQKAIDMLTRALSTHARALGTLFEVFKELAECHLLIGLSDQSQVYLHKALELRPEDSSLWLLSGQLLIRLGQPAKATESFKNALFKLPHQKLSPEEVDIARSAHAELAAIAAAEGNIDMATQELMATLHLPPLPPTRSDEHAALWCALLTARERADDIGGAISACENGYRAIGLDHPRLLVTNAHLLLLASAPQFYNPALAIVLLEKVIAQEKAAPGGLNEGEGDFLPWYLLGKAYTLADQPTKAYEVYQVAITRASSSPLPWLAVGLLYLQLAQLSDAFEAYSQAAKLQTDDNSLAIAPAWEGLSCVYERCDNQFVDAADACLRAASCYRASGNTRAAAEVEARARELSLAARKEGPPPALRNPSELPTALLRDLVNVSPSVRIETVKHQRELHARNQQQAQAQAQVQQQAQARRGVQYPAQAARPVVLPPVAPANGITTPQVRPAQQWSPNASMAHPHQPQPPMGPTPGAYYYGPGQSLQHMMSPHQHPPGPMPRGPPEGYPPGQHFVPVGQSYPPPQWR